MIDSQTKKANPFGMASLRYATARDYWRSLPPAVLGISLLVDCLNSLTIHARRCKHYRTAVAYATTILSLRSPIDSFCTTGLRGIITRQLKQKRNGIETARPAF